MGGFLAEGKSPKFQLPRLVLGVAGKGEEGHNGEPGVAPGDEGGEVEVVGEDSQVDELGKKGDQVKERVCCLEGGCKVVYGNKEWWLASHTVDG